MLVTRTISSLDRTTVYMSCFPIEFLVRILPPTAEWFHACVAIERTVASVVGTTFSRKRSLAAAKRVTLCVVMLNMITAIHDPIYRHIVDDQEEQRL